MLPSSTDVAMWVFVVVVVVVVVVVIWGGGVLLAFSSLEDAHFKAFSKKSTCT